MVAILSIDQVRKILSDHLNISIHNIKFTEFIEGVGFEVDALLDDLPFTDLDTEIGEEILISGIEICNELEGVCKELRQLDKGIQGLNNCGTEHAAYKVLNEAFQIADRKRIELTNRIYILRK